MEIALSLSVLTTLLLIGGAAYLARRGGSRRQVVLMLILAVVIAVNVAIWTVPVSSGETLAGQAE